ncbi:hypothetical protein AGMMS49991_01830 [Spirochaetia bacterium]|nr:hypothetical protein AGMMS49991_01830 [Spirochaetia bacterium]
MVIHNKYRALFRRVVFLSLFAVSMIFVEACNVDLLGIFGSGDLDIRLEDRDTFNFLTPDMRAPPSFGNEYSFIVLSDTHIEDGDDHGLLEKLASVIDADVKFVVITGDITQYGGREDVQKIIDIANSLADLSPSVPCYPVLGNHDVYFNNWPVWKELIGSSRYRIDTSDGGTTLFILDSANAYFGTAQLDWLERELKTANGYVFVFTHTNLFLGDRSSIVEVGQLTDIRERARVVSLLNGRADAMFTGHIHQRIIKQIGGVHYITLEDYVRNKTYCRVSVSPSRIEWEFKKL